MNQIEVLVILDILELDDKNKFENFIKEEGFNKVAEEDFVYTGKSTTTTFATKAYILETFKKALNQTKFKKANLVFLLNETPYPAYFFDKDSNSFEIVKL